MFGSKKLKMENEALKQELASLKDKYQTDVETLERQLKEAKQLLNTAQQRYESSDELMSSSLKGGDMLKPFAQRWSKALNLWRMKTKS